MTGRAFVEENLKSITICLDSYENSLMKGQIYHGAFADGKQYDNLMQLILIIESILEATGFPKAVTEKRLFSPPKGANKKEGLNYTHIIDFNDKRGKLATFRLKILFRQNASWQGSIAWLEKKAEVSFRSALEMILLINDAAENLTN